MLTGKRNTAGRAFAGRLRTLIALSLLLAVCLVCLGPPASGSPRTVPSPAAGYTYRPSAKLSAVNKTAQGAAAPEDEYGLEVHYINVGQADAALVLCDGAAMLIDGGNADDSSQIYSYLKHRGIDHLNVIVATHPHEDHVGGLAGALNYATVDTVYCSVSDYPEETFQHFKKYLAEQGREIVIPKAGDRLSLGGAELQIVGIDRDAPNVNDTSIVLRMVYGETSFLFMGDAGFAAEEKILSEGYELDSTVIKIGHHGSSSSTSEALLKAVSPEYAVISVGKYNSFALPAAETLTALEEAGVTLYRTDMQGSIVCRSNGKDVRFSVADTRHLQANVFIKPTAEELSGIVAAACRDCPETAMLPGGTLSGQAVSSTLVELCLTLPSAVREEQLQKASEAIVGHVERSIQDACFPREVAVRLSVQYSMDGDSTVPLLAAGAAAAVKGRSAEPAGEEAAADRHSVDYIGNTNTKKFHYSDCKSVDKMKESHKFYYSGTREEMIEMGFVPCGNCHP